MDRRSFFVTLAALCAVSWRKVRAARPRVWSRFGTSFAPRLHGEEAIIRPADAAVIFNRPPHAGTIDRVDVMQPDGTMSTRIFDPPLEVISGQRISLDKDGKVYIG